MIFCCGEAVIDMIPGTGGTGFVPHPGGAAVNSAVALARLEVPVGLIAGLSKDPFGAQLLDHLTTNGVSVRWTVHKSTPSTMAFVHLYAGDAQYSFYDRHTAGRDITANDIQAIPTDIDAALFGGISLIHDPSAQAFMHLAHRLQGSTTIFLDPNIRSALIVNESDYRARLVELAEMADIVKLSEEDIGWLGTKTQLSGRCLTLITRGAQGATARFTNGVCVDVPGQIVDVVDTVGAGDTFNAAFLASLRSLRRLGKKDVPGLSIDDVRWALEFACLAASLSITKGGASPPYLNELPPMDLFPQEET